jgi:peroxiredoxin
VAQLCQYRDELERLNVEVLLVSFSSAKFGRIWLEETCAPFRLLIDRERTTYRTYGLERSLSRSWNLKTVWSYAQLMRAGRKWRGIQGDSAQLGGDFIVDSDGVVRLAYHSRDPTDRPSVEQLVTVLNQLHSRQ